MLLSTRLSAPSLAPQRTRRDSSDDRDDQRLQGHQARPRRRAQAHDLHAGARRPARVDAVVGRKGALPPPQRVGGDDLAQRGPRARRRARLPRPLLPGGVRRPGRRLLLLAGPRRVPQLLRLGRPQHGLRRPHRHGPAADQHARHRGPQAALHAGGDRRQEDRLPRDHRAGGAAPTSPGSGPRRSATATNSSSTARRRSSPTAPAPTSSSSSSRPTPRRRTRGSASWSSTSATTTATRSRASASRASSRRWGCTPPTRPN